MKFFLAFAAVVAVAVASPVLRNRPGTNEFAEIEAIIAAIQSPSTDPATAALLEQQLASIISELSPIVVGPAIIETSPIAVGPEIIDFPVPDGGDVTVDEPALIIPSPVVQPSPVIVGEVPAGSSPLVQIIVNVNGQPESVVAPSPAETPVIIVEPEQVVEPIIVEPEQVVEPIIVEPEQVVEPIVVEPVQVVEPIIVEPVQVGTPVLPAPAVVLPEELN